MELKNQIISDIETLPEHALRVISVVVKEFIVLTAKQNVTVRPVRRRPFSYGCMKGKVRISDDFNEPMDDFKEYV